MSLNPLVASENIIEKYLRYIETTFYIDDKDYMKQFKSYLEKKDFFASTVIRKDTVPHCRMRIALCTFPKARELPWRVLSTAKKPL